MNDTTNILTLLGIPSDKIQSFTVSNDGAFSFKLTPLKVKDI